MGRRKYGLNQKEVNKALKKYGPTGTIGILLLFIGINIIGFGFISSSINPQKNSQVGAIVLGIMFFILGIVLIVVGKKEIIKQENERFQEQQRLIEQEKEIAKHKQNRNIRFIIFPH